MSATTWATLPNEMKLAVVDLLDNVKDIRALSKTERNMYSLAIPSLFQSINLRSWNSISHFIQNVPLSYLAHTHNLQLSTRVPPTAHHVPKTDAIIALLASSPRLKSLTLSLHGPLDKRVIPLFKSLPSLTTLSIANTADENVSPISERFVVAIALSIPNLQSLSLDTITRSQLHASLSTDLLSHHSPYLPLVIGDSDIPNNPTLPLSLPSLLTIPSLKHLSIQNTHLGDPLWSSPSSASAQCNLTSLSLGCTSYESDEYNSLCVERILARVGNTLDNIYLESSLSSSFPPPPSTHAPTPLPKLRKLSLSTTSLSLSPSSSTPPPLTLTLTQPQTNQTNPPTLSTHLSSTVERLRTSPIETLSIRCWEEDVQEVCQALEGVLSLRVERGGCVGVNVDGGVGEDVGLFEEVDGRDSNNGSEIERLRNPRLSSGGGGGELGFYQHLRRVDVSIATPQYPDDDDDDADDDADDDDDEEEEEEEKQARETAITNLLSFCSDLGLIGVVAYERKQRSNTNTNPHTNTLPPSPTDTKAEADKQLSSSSSSSSMLGSNANGKMLLTARFPRHGFNYGV